jgi:predicted PurR-regulated permease PerM
MTRPLGLTHACCRVGTRNKRPPARMENGRQASAFNSSLIRSIIRQVKHSRGFVGSKRHDVVCLKRLIAKVSIKDVLATAFFASKLRDMLEAPTQKHIRSTRSPDAATLASWIMMGVALFLVMYLHLLPGLLLGLLVYELVHFLAPLLQRRFTSRLARLVSVVALAVLTIGLVILFIVGIVAFFKSDAGTLPSLADKVQHILDDARTKLPPWLVENLPGDVSDLKLKATDWLGEHSKDVQHAGKEVGHLFLRIVIGMVVGALVSLHEGQPTHQLKPFARALLERVARFGDAFRRIVFAQVRISALNTAFTAIFLFLFLPLFGVHLPLAKTLVAITFLTGLLPVIGNLISNTLITIVALSVSVFAGVAALVFLILIHKLEYFLNARIVGVNINAHAWEILGSMILMEAAFGIPGLIAAPIYYAYIKRELVSAGAI